MPTIKQKLAAKKVLQGKTIKHAMLEVGYAESTANTTGKLTRSQGFQEIMKRHISDEKLAQVLAEGLEATKLSGTGGMRLGIKANGDVSEVGHPDIEVPDYAVRHKYLETGLKVHGYLNNQDNGSTTNILILAGEQKDRLIDRAARRRASIIDGSEESPSGLYDSNQPEI